MWLKDTIHFTRIQTATGEALMYILALLWLVPDINWYHVGFVYGWSVLAHATSFGHNNVMDFRLGYDQKDPHKADSPLVATRWSVDLCHWVVVGAQLALAVSMVFFLESVADHPIPAVAAFGGYIVLGMTYNDGLGKGSRVGSLLAVGAHVCLATTFWFVSHGLTWDMAVMLLVVLAGVYILYFVQGALKDIHNDEEGVELLKRLWRIENRMIHPTWAGRVWLIAPVSLWLTLTFTVMIRGASDMVTWIGYCVVIVAVTWIALRGITERPYKRRIEVFSFALLYLLVITGAMWVTLPWYVVLCAYVLAFANYLGINRLAWGQNTPGI